MSQLPETGFVRAKQLLGDKKKGIPAILPIGPTKFWLMVRDGQFPKPKKIGTKTTVWRVEDIRAYLAAD